ncbi:MAG: hypothetical protein QXJ13_07985 [Candidatus Bathyarchaeia archaeon]
MPCPKRVCQRDPEGEYRVTAAAFGPKAWFRPERAPGLAVAVPSPADNPGSNPSGRPKIY